MFKRSSAHLLVLAAMAMTLAKGLKASELEAPCPLDRSAGATGMPSTERIFGWVEGMAQIGPRRTGTEGGFKASAYVKCQFERLGLQDVHYEHSTSWLWDAKRSSLAVNGTAINSFPVAYSFVTPDKPSQFTTGPSGLNAEIVDVGAGQAWQIDPARVKGKVVLFDLKFQISTAFFLPITEFLWDPKLTILEPALFTANPYITNLSSVVKRLEEAGAVGFVGVLADYFDSNKYFNEYYRRTQMTLPGVWVTRTDGAALRAGMKDMGRKPSQAQLVLEGSRTEVPARIVVGTLPGKSLDTVLVTSHHDSVWEGGVEDASGVGSLLAQAQYAASKPADEREKTLLFVTMDTHFTGYQAHQAFTEKYIVKRQTPYNVVAGVTLEHVAKQGVIKNGQLEIKEQPELMGILETLGPVVKRKLKSSIIKHDLRRSALLNAGLLCKLGGIPTDASFWCGAGLPTASLISAPVYLYDEADTLDKVAKDQLLPVAYVFADLIEALDKTPVKDIGR